MKIFFILLLTLLILGGIYIINKDSNFPTLGKYLFGLTRGTYSKLSPSSIEDYLEDENVFVVDTRNNTISSLGYLPNSVLLPLNLEYSRWFPALIKEGSNVVLICDETNYKDSIKQTEKLRSYNILGYAIYDEIIKTKLFDINIPLYNENTKREVQKLFDKNEYLLDIREVSEFKETGVIEQAHLLPLSELKDKYQEIPEYPLNMYIFCKGGGRSLIAMSFLHRVGHKNRIYIMRGGITKTISEKVQLVPYTE